MYVIKNARIRSALRYLIPSVLIPALVVLSAVAFEGKRYLIIAFGVAVLAIVLFFTGFEEKKVGSRRLVVVSVLAALCVAGRFIPLFKPVTALTIIAGIYLGAEAGFLTGAMAALVSNFAFGQGPWTAFQMLGWGMIGLAVGGMSSILKNHRWLLLAYGALSGAAYSLIMDIWTVLWYSEGFEWQLYMASVVAALPHTVIYSISNVVFLWLTAKPFGEKLERIKLKYGM